MSNATAAELAEPDTPAPRKDGSTVIPMTRPEPLRDCVLAAVRAYLRNMDGQDVEGMHKLVMDEVERPLIETVLENSENNQSKAARILGISRSTLRKKLASYVEAGSPKPAPAR
jgi:Fis family transcriptional regulator